ncbi:MAG TPA: aspartate kinase, partial [Vulgatibacter sp.]
ERISMALLSMALNARGVPAVSFTGSQSGIITTDTHANARIVEVRPFRVQEELERGKVVIVAGYQGVSLRKEVTTLGRGGSDTTAVALAAALGAEACEIYSDVDGVYTADPRLVPDAKRLAEISYEEMQELAESGAKVLHAQAVEFAKEKGIAIHARSTFGGSGETVIRPLGDAGLQGDAPGRVGVGGAGAAGESTVSGESGAGSGAAAESAASVGAGATGRAAAGSGTGAARGASDTVGRIVGVTSERDLALLMASPGNVAALAELLEHLDLRGSFGKQLLFDRLPSGAASLVLSRENLPDYGALVAELAARFGGGVSVREGVGAVSIIGAGINASFANVRKVQAALAACGAEPLQLSTSSFRISVLLEEDHVAPAVRALHDALVS